jgi:hypothetical protein
MTRPTHPTRTYAVKMPVNLRRLAMRVAVAGAALLVGGVLNLGCAVSRGKPSMESPDPALRVPAIKAAAGGKGVKAEGQLVSLVAALSDPDAGIRLFAIQSLEARTGESFGFVYYQTYEERRPAIERWNTWLVGRGLAPTAGLGNESGAATLTTTAPTSAPTPAGMPAGAATQPVIVPVSEVGR